MSSNEIAIEVNGLSKCYQIYDRPRDRLKQFFAPKLQRVARRESRRYFREFWALRDVTFSIKKGETKWCRQIYAIADDLRHFNPDTGRNTG